ncbi:MAG: DUF3108 domain-containing protein [Acidobacteria bacterium]|jgi:hypothetical protein|nr:MAG: DUF3108 domain-containing protein [Acidobacteriota bacterium]GIU82322.1 MAG: hypothetical protein KatS3mg006_1386 [Pyrinomonadaceae bacterium]
MKVLKSLIFLALFCISCFSQTYRVGEKITYNISFGSVKEAGYAEFFVVSSGKLKGEDAIELQAKFRTMNLLNAFYPINQTRICYVSAKTGLPLYNRVIFDEEIAPQEKTQNFLETPTVHHNLLTAFYEIRSGKNGITFQEDGKTYSISWELKSKKKIKTDIGEFNALVLNLRSDFFDELGIRNFQMSLTDDAEKLPILISFRNEKGEFRASIASFQMIKPEPKEPPAPVPTPMPTPKPPPPKPTPTPYIENQPLSTELPFVLGETLSYKLNFRDEEIGTVVLQAKERKQIKEKDSLVLTATVTRIKPQSFLSAGDTLVSQVEPFVLTPFGFEAKLKGYSESVSFNQESGLASIQPNTSRIEIPVGTHSLLSLAYAIRTFSFSPIGNKARDVRVAVFLNKKYYIVTLRPSGQEEINFNGKKVATQVISISANVADFDKLNAKVWLSNDASRLPLRFTVGDFRADLTSVEVILPKTN